MSKISLQLLHRWFCWVSSLQSVCDPPIACISGCLSLSTIEVGDSPWNYSVGVYTRRLLSPLYLFEPYMSSVTRLYTSTYLAHAFQADKDISPSIFSSPPPPPSPLFRPSITRATVVSTYYIVRDQKNAVTYTFTSSCSLQEEISWPNPIPFFAVLYIYVYHHLSHWFGNISWWAANWSNELLHRCSSRGFFIVSKNSTLIGNDYWIQDVSVERFVFFPCFFGCLGEIESDKECLRIAHIYMP